MSDSPEGGPGRGRGLGGGRGAALLAALKARRPEISPGDTPSTTTPSSASPELTPVSTPGRGDGAPGPSMGRALAFQQMLAKRAQQATAAPNVGFPRDILVGGCLPPDDRVVGASVAPLAPVAMGRGTLAKLRSMIINVPPTKLPETEVVASQQFQAPQAQLSQAVSSQAQAVIPESKPILDHQEKPPVIKRGVAGAKVDIVANYVRVNIDPGKGIFEYEVRFDPSQDSRDMRFKLLNQHRETLGPARTFDGVTLYLPYQMPDQVTIWQSTHPVTNEAVAIKIHLRQKRRAADSIHFYNVLIRKIARILGMVQMHRNYFNPNSPIFMPVEKLEVWPGYVTAVNEFEGGLMLCCDVSFRVLRTTTVLDELVEMSKRGTMFHKMAQEVLIGLNVLTRYNNRMYRIDEILFDKNPQSTFDCQGKLMTFTDYYKEHYNIDIKDRGQPLLLNRLKKKVAGKEDETVLACLIPELCFLTGLDDRLRTNFTIMRELAKHTKVAPMQREQALQKYIESVNNNEKAARVLSEWGLTLAPRSITLEGRTLEPERIILGKRTITTNPQCDWTRDLFNDILVAVKINNWLLVCTDKDNSKAQDFSKCLIEVAQKMGIKINSPKMISLNNDRTDTYVTRIRDEINPALELVVAIFPTSRDDRYAAVKTLLTAQAAVPSQMINARTISQATKLRSVTQKIALQINCKMGGELWAVNIPTKTMMVCGVDVYHDPTRRGQSVVGFVASVNPAMTRWYSRAKNQVPGIELVDTLKICLMESLQKYHEANHDYPKMIVLFRDGVGDGQLSFTVDHEVPQFLSAFDAVVLPDGAKYAPKFTMVIVQKRINTRFFLSNRTGQLSNPPPGTIIDHTVTRRDWWDFFLVSQHVTQGTVSPTHFLVVHDGGLPPDNLQKLAYKMTHMYYNWPGTIRVPAPCQYAHKLAYLVGQSIRRDVKEELCNRLYFL